MRVFVMCVLAASVVACGGASPDIVESFQSEDTGSTIESGAEAQVADSGASDTVAPSADSGTDTVTDDVVETGTDTAPAVETSADTAPAPDTMVADTTDTSPLPDTASPPDTSAEDTSVAPDTSTAIDSPADSADTAPADTGSDTGSADTYVPPPDTAPTCMYASGARVTTGDSSAVLLNGTFMCYEVRVRRSALPGAAETLFETSNPDYLKVWMDTSGVIAMSASKQFPAFSRSALSLGAWHTVAACKVPDTTTGYYRLQVFVDGVSGDLSSTKVPLSVSFTPGTFTFGWTADYDRMRVYKSDGTTLGQWNMDGNANDTGPTGLNATGSPAYTATTCP